MYRVQQLTAACMKRFSKVLKTAHKPIYVPTSPLAQIFFIRPCIHT